MWKKRRKTKMGNKCLIFCLGIHFEQEDKGRKRMRDLLFRQKIKR